MITETESALKLLPKVELHLHLDCSLSFDVVRKLRPQIYETEYKNNFIAPEKCLNLADFLKCASSGINLMQTESELRAVVEDLFNQLKSENVIFTEIRFAPLLHLRGGLSAEAVVEIVTDSIKSFADSSQVGAKLILCTLRHFSEDESLKTIKLVERFVNESCVVGFDLAADEAGFPIDNHIKAFKYAIKKDIPRTAHAGEARGAESVWETLEKFKPQRIGHGVRCIEDSKLIDHLIKNNVHLEVCPTCNIQTNVFKEYYEHPIDFLYSKGVSVGINTDARSLVNISLTEEYAKLMKVFNWEIIDLYKCNQNALNHAFISEEEKKVLQRKLETGYQNFFLRNNKLANKIKTTFVPCNGCTLCCQGDAIRLTEEDNLKDYLTEPHPYISGALMLAHKPNGDCIYLVESGCSIHDRAPSLCKSADCRSIALKYDFDTAMKLHNMKRIDIRVWDKGNDLIKEMKKK